MNPSRTSVWVAAARALGAREPDPNVRNPDWVAAKLIGPEERALLGDSSLLEVLDQPDEIALKNLEVMSSARMMLVRTKFIDSRLEAAVRHGATQVVILGAGYDSRAYRLTELLRDVQIFEVDQPATQQMKITRVRKALGDPPANLTYVPLDFRADDLSSALASAGYRSNQKTFFIWEGVTMYLPAEAVKQTLRWVSSHSGRGSTIVFDYTYDVVVQMWANLDIDKLPEPQKQMAIRFKRLVAGEPWLFGLPLRGEQQFLQEVGLELSTILGVNSAEAVSRYLTRADGSIFGDMPATEQQGYLLLEAAALGVST